MARNVKRFWVEVNRSDAEWFQEQYPTMSLGAITSMLLEEFRTVNDLTAKDYAKLAAESLGAKLNGEVSE